MRGFWACLLLAACGRLGFDPVAGLGDGGGGGGGDAAAGGDAAPSSAFTLFATANGSTVNALIHDTAVGPDRTVYVTGSYGGNLELGGMTAPAGVWYSMFLAALFPDGSVSWLRSYGDTGGIDGRVLGVDQAGDVIVAGILQGASTVGTFNVDSLGDQDPLFVRHRPDGTLTDVRHVPRGGGNLQTSSGRIGPGGLILTGSVMGELDLGGGIVSTNGGDRSFLGVLAPDWAPTRVLSFAAPSGDSSYGAGASQTAGGDTCVVGAFATPTDFGDGVRTPVGDWDGFVVCHRADGSVRWIRTFGSASTESANDVVADDDGGCFVVGTLSDSVDLGAGAEVAQGLDAFVARFDGTGDPIWVQVIGGAGTELGSRLALHAGTLVAGGFLGGPADVFGRILTHAGSSDIFVVGLDEQGQGLWAFREGGTADETLLGLAVDPANGDVLASGWFIGDTVMGGVSASSPAYSSYLHRFAP